MPNFGTKKALFCILGLEFQNNIFLFEINDIEFLKVQYFAKKLKCLNLG